MANFLNIFNKDDKYDYKIVEIRGGLGNQMFQYAFGKSLAKKTGKKILYNINIYEKLRTQKDSEGYLPNGIFFHDYNLDLFNLDIQYADSNLIYEVINKKASNMTQILDILLERQETRPEQITEKNPFKFDSRLFKAKNKRYYSGYFLNPKYFDGIADEIRKDFTFPAIPKDDTYNTDLLNRITACENSVFVHIRRKDYLNLKGWALEPQYYKNALKYISEKIENPTFFIFGEYCEDFIKNEFKWDYNFEYIGNVNTQNNENWKDLYLMTQCKHAIIANSTFSWWGAFLTDNKEKIVVAPKPFLLKGGNSIVCKNWIQIKRKK